LIVGDIRVPAGPILCVVGARPNFMKMAPILRALGARQDLPQTVLVHTGQHYDAAMNDQLFAGLGLPAPDLNLEVGSASHAAQTAEIMKRFEPALDRYAPSCVLVVGDVNSTIACSLVAVKKGVSVIHVEAGLRSFDRRMPEEINRVLTDQIADLLYTTERSAHENLAREGIAAERVHFVGNVMIDSLRAHLPRAVSPVDTLRKAGASTEAVAGGQRYGVVTLHRPSNVDEPDALAHALGTLAEASRRLPLVFPIHPRTRTNMERFGLSELLAQARVTLIPPQGYLEMLGLMAGATVVLTDSGGVQEETTALSIPCITLRDTTERPITAEQGTNTVVGGDRALALAVLDEIVAAGGRRGRVPELWDGHAAERIAAHLAGWLAARQTRVKV
jgi:UDP-N-acetylglucosamine 2-epimerase (non-hydrolysing)